MASKYPFITLLWVYKLTRHTGHDFAQRTVQATHPFDPKTDQGREERGRRCSARGQGEGCVLVL